MTKRSIACLEPFLEDHGRKLQRRETVEITEITMLDLPIDILKRIISELSPSALCVLCYTNQQLLVLVTTNGDLSLGDSRKLVSIEQMWSDALYCGYIDIVRWAMKVHSRTADWTRFLQQVELYNIDMMDLIWESNTNEVSCIKRHQNWTDPHGKFGSQVVDLIKRNYVDMGYHINNSFSEALNNMHRYIEIPRLVGGENPCSEFTKVDDNTGKANEYRHHPLVASELDRRQNTVIDWFRTKGVLVKVDENISTQVNPQKIFTKSGAIFIAMVMTPVSQKKVKLLVLAKDDV